MTCQQSSSVANMIRHGLKLNIPVPGTDAEVAPRNLLNAHIHLFQDPGPLPFQLNCISALIPRMLVNINNIKTAVTSRSGHSRVKDAP